MALMHYDFKSLGLRKSSSFYAVVPDCKFEKDLKVLYLLHGMGDDHTKWIRRTNLEQYAKKLDLVIVTPQFEKSFYSNMVYGENYWDFLTVELPELIEKLLPVSKKREDTFVAGSSMGGFGAFKWALNFPQKFSVAASFSGALLLDQFFSEQFYEKVSELDVFESAEEHKKICKMIFGNTFNISQSDNDLLFLIKKNENLNKKLPKLIQMCGLEDPLLNMNEEFYKQISNINNDQYSYEKNIGDHSWNYWDNCIKQFLNLLELKNDSVKNRE